MRTRAFFCLLVFILLPACMVQAQTLEAPDLNARAAILMDLSDRSVLYAKNPHRRLPPASTTKVLTALLTLERLPLYDKVIVSPSAAAAPPSRIGLRPSDRVMVQDLLYGLLLRSGNDAAEVLAEAVAGSVADFAEQMNRRAFEMGAFDTHFVNPHGLPADDHFSTVYDLALMFRHALRNPEFADIVRTHQAALSIEQPDAGGLRLVRVRNTNRLLGVFDGARGGKTGYTRAARRCFVGLAERDGVQLVVAVLGSRNPRTLWEDTRSLFEYGFTRRGRGAGTVTVSLPQEAEARPTAQGG